jgi:hypothetical protein
MSRHAEGDSREHRTIGDPARVRVSRERCGAGHRSEQPRPARAGRSSVARRLTIAALGIVSVLAVSTVSAGSAAAAPLWLVCLEGSGLTKYESSKCLKASSGGKWQSEGVPTGKTITVKLAVLFLSLKDTKVPFLGESEVQCYSKGGRGEGVIEEGGKGTVRTLAVEKPAENCKGTKVCEEKGVETVEGLNLPWKTEVVEETEKLVSKLLAGTSGKEPGWKVTCKTSLGSETDECLAESSSVAEKLGLINEIATTSGTEELLIKAHLKSVGEAKCSQGGAKAGKTTGTLAILLPGGALSVGPGHKAGSEAQPEFRLEGKGTERTTDEFAEEAKVSEPLVLEAEGGNEPAIECKKMQLVHGVIPDFSSEILFKSIHWDECVDKSEASCEVPTIETGELKDTIQEDGTKGETDEKFEPKSGKEIAKFTLKSKTGEVCNKAGELKLDGDFISKQEDHETDEDEHVLGINVTTASKELEYGDQFFFGSFHISFGWHLNIAFTWGLLW